MNVGFYILIDNLIIVFEPISSELFYSKLFYS